MHWIILVLMFMFALWLLIKQEIDKSSQRSDKMGSPLRRMKHQYERNIPLSQDDISWLIKQAEYAKALAEKLDDAVSRNRKLMSANTKLRNESAHIGDKS